MICSEWFISTWWSAPHSRGSQIQNLSFSAKLVWNASQAINCSSHTRMRYTQTNLPPALKHMQFDYGIWTSTPAIALSWILPGAAHIENNPGWESPSFRMRTPHTFATVAFKSISSRGGYMIILSFTNSTVWIHRLKSPGPQVLSVKNFMIVFQEFTNCLGFFLIFNHFANEAMNVLVFSYIQVALSF